MNKTEEEPESTNELQLVNWPPLETDTTVNIELALGFFAVSVRMTR